MGPPYLVEEDEISGKHVRGTRRRAAIREKPKVHRESGTGKTRRSQDVSVYPAEQSTSLAQRVEVANKDKAVKLERRGSTSSTTKSPRKSNRPSSAHRAPKTIIVNNSSRPDSTYYGIPSPAVRTPGVSQHHGMDIRPRASASQTYPRPTSYSSAASPPLSNSAYYPQVAPQYQVTSEQDYLTPHAMSRPLASRFDPIARAQSTIDTIPRTNSAFGVRDMDPRRIRDTYESGYYDDGYMSANEGATIRRKDRRNTIIHLSAGSTFSKADADSAAMPPPSRPGILRRSTADDYGVDSVGQELDVRDTRTQYRDEPRPVRRPSSNRHSVSYDLGKGSEGVRIEPANTSRRRQSWYDQAASSGTSASSTYEDKLNQAASYQEDVGGPTVPLMAEVLKRQQRREAGGSRSTKSSASQDESDYKKSATTQTTRSGSENDDENVTIKVTGTARVMVGGAQIDCADDGTIEIKRRQSIRGGSEQSNSKYGEGQIEGQERDRRSPVMVGVQKKSPIDHQTASKSCIPMPNLTSTYERLQKNGRKALRVILKGIAYLACPDSGSDKNIISQEFARENKVRVRRGKNDKKLFELGNGTYIESLGRAHIPCSLAKAPFPRRKQWFHVLANCAVPLIMGRPFLEETQILTKNRHLLERCPPELLSISSLKFIGSPRNRSGIGISLNGRVLMATPDTGSDLNLISLACAEREGFYIDRSREARQRLQVADGSEVKTVGRVYISSLSLDWRKAQTIWDRERPEYMLEGDDAINNLDSELDVNEERDTPGEIFDVVNGLPCDVILGEAFLDKTDAFNTCTELFTNYPERKKHAFELKIFRYLGPVQARFSRKSTKPPDNPPDELARQQHDAGLLAERYRRSKAKRLIEELDGSEQTVAAVVEQATTQAYDRLHVRCNHCHPERAGS